MDDIGDDLTAIFEGQRTHLRAVAYRLLGSVHEADDAVQETWLRLQRSDVADVDNLPAWLTTVVSRICLDQLRSRTSRREDLGADLAAGRQLAARRPRPRSRGRGRARRRGRSRAAGRPRHPRARRAAGLLPARSVRAVLRRDRDRPSVAAAPPAGSWPVGPGAGCAVRRRPSRWIGPGTARWSRPSWTPPATAGSIGWCRCCTPTRWWPQTRRPWRWGRPRCSAAPTRWRSSTTDAPEAARLAELDGFAAAKWTLRGEVKVVFAFTVEDGLIREIELLAGELDRLDLRSGTARTSTRAGGWPAPGWTSVRCRPRSGRCRPPAVPARRRASDHLAGRGDHERVADPVGALPRVATPMVAGSAWSTAAMKQVLSRARARASTSHCSILVGPAPQDAGTQITWAPRSASAVNRAGNRMS